MSSAEMYGENIVISSRGEGFFGEYDINGNVIRSFTTSMMCYRIKKYNFKEIWFE